MSPAGVGADADPPLAALLAGGSGSRLGGAKAIARLAGEPLLAHVLASVRAAGIEPIVVAKEDTELPPLAPSGAGVRVLVEPDLPRHPLTGIVTALRAAGERPLVVLACDMPFAEPRLLSYLGAAPEPLVVPAPGGRAQPLQARYSALLLPQLESALELQGPLRETISALRPRLLGDEELRAIGVPERAFFNVNDDDDLRAAETLVT